MPRPGSALGARPKAPKRAAPPARAQAAPLARAGTVWSAPVWASDTSSRGGAACGDGSGPARSSSGAAGPGSDRGPSGLRASLHRAGPGRARLVQAPTAGSCCRTAARTLHSCWRPADTFDREGCTSGNVTRPRCETPGPNPFRCPGARRQGAAGRTTDEALAPMDNLAAALVWRCNRADVPGPPAAARDAPVPEAGCAQLLRRGLTGVRQEPAAHVLTVLPHTPSRHVRDDVKNLDDQDAAWRSARGEPATARTASAPSRRPTGSAHAGSVTASAPEAATASRPFRVTLLMRFPAFQTWSRAFARTG
ncbi:hypothetical protein SVIOM342S_05587 [Streptomyces violaceorubidus]